MKHPNSGKPAAAIIDLACAYLPPCGINWTTTCAESINWLNDRAKELDEDDRQQEAWWFYWRACDPVHVALLAMERSRVAPMAIPTPDTFLAGWQGLLAEIHGRRMAQYIARKRLFTIGGAG